MTEFEIQTQWVKVPNGDLEIDAYLAQPTGEGRFPGVVVFQEVFGVNVHIRDVTERLAKEGYVTIAPALYQRLEPGFEVGYGEEDLKKGREYKVQTKASELLSDTQASIDYLKTLSNTTDKFGCIGFCFGGHVAYLVAQLDDLDAVASFYGAGIAVLCPGEENQVTIDFTKDIAGTIYLFFGTEDPLVPLLQVDEIEAALTEHKIDYKIFRYEGAGHGFFCDRRASYLEEAARDAWQHTLQLYDRVLR
ncbi:MAG: dienelactone hydrolase family protein [Cyanobacteria bacterium SID2]|nr:dienelactone hydrolase family protein [Cyanobacteria bacterium SID2]MBP0005528.1 dienelactone hydrolase family protein [Cyanobacteria bacterium SBC]